MSVLPLNWPDKVDSPELLAWLQQSGIEKYIDAAQINSIRDALNELYFSSNPDRIISLGTETIDGNEHTYEDYTWQLGGVQINNIGNPSIIVIPSANVGFKRKDISVFTAAGTIERIAGTETDGEVVTSPDVPEGTLYYKSYDIDGDTIGVDPEPPAIDGSIYKKKIENTRWKSTQSGTDVVIPFQAAGQMHYSVVNSGLISVAGFSTANLTGPLYEGIDVLFENQTGNPITLKNMFGGISTPVKFNFGADLIVPNGGKLWMRVRNREFELIMKSWSEVDLSTKADLVGGKVPSSQLPSYVIEGYFNGTNFYTDAGFTNFITPESGKIYVALDTNSTYRWSGSAYVQIGGGASGDIENYFVNSINWSRYITRASMSGNTYLGASLISPTGTQVSIRLDGVGHTIAKNIVFRVCYIKPTSNEFSEILSPQIDKSDFQIGIFTGLFIFNPGANSTFRSFAGASNVTAFGNINPSQYTSYLFGVGCDDTDTNYQLIYGNNSSSRVKIDLGWPKNINRIIMIKFNQTTSSGNTDVYVKSVLDGLEFTTSVNYRFKGGWRVWANRGNTSIISDINCGYSNVEIIVRNDI